MLAVCSALAYATELSDSTFAATAAFTGAARFALMSDIAARSGSSSPASSVSSSRVSGRYSCGLFSAMVMILPWFPVDPSVVGLGDVRRLMRVRERGRVVRDRVQRDGGVDRRRDVGVDERHGGALGQLLAGELGELLA